MKKVGLILALCMVGYSHALTAGDLFPYGSNYQGTATEETVNVINKTEAFLLDYFTLIDIPTSLPSFRIFGANLGQKVYINFNGHITFGDRWKPFNPYLINATGPSVLAIFAPFYSDNDPRRPPGMIFQRLTTDPTDLNLANTLIRNKGFTSFTSRYCIVATWENIKYYVQNITQRYNPNFFEQNTYQAILCTDGVDGHVIYQYLKLQWGRSQDISTNFATTGWHVKGATVPGLSYWVAPFSGQSSLMASLITGSNVNFPGRWMRSQAITGECSGRSNGVYAKNCTAYTFCCNQQVEKIALCPAGTNYHPPSTSCVDARNYPCSGNFCTGRADGRYARVDTPVLTDFYECRNQTTRIFFCSHGFSFGTTSRCI